MKGGVHKMSEIAVQKAHLEAGDHNSYYMGTEEEEQSAVFEWASWMVKQLPDLDLLFHVPNGGWRSKPEAARLKKAGVKPGVPDLCLPVPSGGFHGLYIELKRRQGGTVSPEQKEWLAALQEKGYRAIVAHGAEEACNEIYRYLTESEQ